ncbi:MAG TPA: PAS domain S-box protein [Verrucomicrobiae bacterium]|nr:PAS domain S-box protein [Verrucomicrobiae bacterium]
MKRTDSAPRVEPPAAQGATARPHKSDAADRKNDHAAQPLRVLIVEDSENDALLLEIELQRAGYAPVCERVETRDAMSAALARQRWDVVIADYVMPRFNGLEALALVKANGLDLPFIIVSGHITDSTAVAAMKAGAHDYVMKDNLARLGSAVQRELREAEGRRARRLSDQKLQVEQVFRHAIENSVPAGITTVDLDGRQTYVNPAFCAMVGWRQEDLIGARPPFVYWPPEHVEQITGELGRLIHGHAPAGGLELYYCRRSGERIAVLVQVTPLKDGFGNITGWVSSNSDITERKQAEARLAAEHAITRLLAAAPSLDLASPGIINALLEGLEADVGGLWIPSDDQESLRLSAMNSRDSSPELRSFIQASGKLCPKRGTDLPGRVWESGQTLWVNPLPLERSYARRDVARTAGLCSGFGFPIQNDGRFFGVLEFFFRRHMEEDEVMLNMLAAIGSEIGQFTQRRNAEEALRRAHDELEIRVQRRTAELKTANSKLQASISERKRLENELLEITEKERRRIALDLHDDLGQRLSGIALMTKGLQLKLEKVKSDTAQDAARIHSLVQEAMTHASDLAHDLATLDLQKKTLTQALGELVDHARELFGITCVFKCNGTVPPLDPHIITQLYKISQEAMTNAIKHAKATNVSLNLVATDQALTLIIDNNGLPFPDLEGRSTGMGLRIMSYRASLIGGSVDIRANGDQGARLTCVVPLETKN